MKCLLVALVTIAVAQAAVITTQFHAQDGHHGYSYGYNNENSEKEESSSHGQVKGEYKVSDKHGLFHTELKYEFPQEHHSHHEHQGFEHEHHHEHPKPFSYSTVVHHPEPHHHHQHHEQHHELNHEQYHDQHHELNHEQYHDQHHELNHDQHHEQNHFNHHYLHKRSLWHHNNDHQQHLSHNELFHHQPSHYGHEEHHHWTGPVHVPVIKNGVPTESPEVQAARKHHEHKLAEAHQHSSHGWEEEHQHHHDHHDHHHDDHQSRWHGPVHVPVIEHGVPTETPEVRQAKAHFLTKHTEAKLHSGHSDYHHHGNQHWSHEHEQHNQHRWTGPVHVPVIEHGVPTETPEVRHAKAHHAAKHAQTHSSHEQGHHFAQHYNHHDHHEARWNGPTHNPVIVHGVPTETPEVRHAKAHFASKHAALQQHAGHGVWDHEEHDHHHGEHRWTGPVHVPVIKHGVPTETPEVRHAKAHLQQKFAEAQSHPDFDKDCDEKSYGQSQEWHHAHKHY